MNGVGAAGGAGSIINAFATGRGVAFGLGYAVTARVQSAPKWRVLSGRRTVRAPENRLAIESARAAQRAAGAEGPLEIHVESPIPPKRGLKSSSAVGVAIASAVLDAADKRVSPLRLLSMVAAAGIKSRTSLTGALDDAGACLLGGVVFADNLKRRIVKRDRLPHDLVALVRTPRRTLATGNLRRASFRRIADTIEEAWRLALRGEYREAMLINTLAYAPLLGQRPRFTLQALAAGAWAAGLSGKGPAEIALVHRDDLRRFRFLQRSAKRVRLNPGAAA